MELANVPTAPSRIRPGEGSGHVIFEIGIGLARILLADPLRMLVGGLVRHGVSAISYRVAAAVLAEVFGNRKPR